MTKAEYVKRLKKMLTSRKKPCGYCPVSSYYNPRKIVKKGMCELCQNFNGLGFLIVLKHDTQEPTAACPCYRPNPQIAIKRAWQKITEYEENHGEI